MTDGKTAGPEGSAERAKRTSEPQPPVAGGGERNAALEEAKDVLRLYQEYKAARPAGAKAEAWDRYADAAALYGDVIAAALLSSPRVEEVRREALEEAAAIAERGCLVPPDGGSPTEAEREMCEAIAEAIRALSLQVE